MMPNRRSTPTDGVVFLDRDGVVNYDSPDYIKSWKEFHFIEGSLEAIARLTQAGFDCMIITNQSAVGRAMITLHTLVHIHDQMRATIVQNGGHIKDIFFCPHTPQADCACRKPKPGLLLQARDKWHIDLSRSWMVGDSAKDILAGRNAGCGQTILVRTGNGKKAEQELKAQATPPDRITADLWEAAGWILDSV